MEIRKSTTDKQVIEEMGEEVGDGRRIMRAAMR